MQKDQYRGIITTLTILLCSCLTSGYAQKKVIAYNHKTVPAPEGMVYIPGGSIIIKYGNGEADSANVKKFSLSAFYIDKTEVTNKQYREFVQWVIDSVAITEYVKDEHYFTDKNRDSTHKYINWSKVSDKKLWRNKDVREKTNAMYQDGEIRKDLYNFAFRYLKMISADKQQKEFVTEYVNVYPDTKTWGKDFPNSQTDMLVQEYFTNPAYDDYPVVGVNWKQARAYTYWRTMTMSNNDPYLKSFHLPYALPTEAQWVHAAQGKPGKDIVIDSNGMLKDRNSKLIANFKQEEGNYTEDGSAYTVPVMAYAPNEMGLYNMLGNAAEWTLDAFNESAWVFVHDQNPVLLYDANDNESDVMKRKVVRGGSWKDNAQSLSPYSRDHEIQNIAHSYIGFRCVMQAPEVLGAQVETRKRK